MKSMMISEDIKKGMMNKLIYIYGEEHGEKIYNEIKNMIEDFLEKRPPKNMEKWMDEKDIVLITYGDQIREEKKDPLESLGEFLHAYVKGFIRSVHLLPFYPYSSDDGFSVIDYFEVNPELGKWEHIENLSKDFELMLDAVINHISAKSQWFQGYLQGTEAYRDFFIETDPNLDFSRVTRPRALPLLTKFYTIEGEKYIWTTFSDDQIDLNYKNEKVLLMIIALLLFYIEKGAKMIRMDAIGYLWKEIGTSCIHLKETHKVVQLFRDIFEIAAPETIIITETNVPHKDNISYFGNGYNEAHMVYQFPLPPLTLHAFHTGNARHLLEWADGLEPISGKVTFFNFLASHDGIGVMPAKGILSEEEVSEMANKVKARGGYISYKDNGDGTRSPYELNINYFDALSNPEDEEDLKIKRFICSQSILLSLAGVPGIYVHSLLGSRNYQEGVVETGRYRSINREKFERERLEEEINNPNHLRHKVFTRYKELIKKRTEEKGFHPNAGQQIIFGNDHVFALLRKAEDGSDEIVCLHNVSDTLQTMRIDLDKADIRGTIFQDTVSGKVFEERKGILEIQLSPYEMMWLKAWEK
ncbi:MAG: alpha-amylase family glycosyl hydrolase [Bacillota bacterium]